jgi:hypothetical protein
MLPRTNFGSASVGTPRFGKPPNLRGPFITGVVSCAESGSRMPSPMFSTRRTRLGSASGFSRRAPPLSSTTRSSPLASSRARPRVRPARLNARSRALPALPTPCPVGHVQAFIHHSDAPPQVCVTENTLSGTDLRAVDGYSSLSMNYLWLQRRDSGGLDHCVRTDKALAWRCCRDPEVRCC